MKTRNVILLVAGVAGAPAIAIADVPPPVAAQPAAPKPAGSVRCSLQIIHALAGEGGFDPALGALKAQLERATLQKFKTFKLLSGSESVLQPGGTAVSALPWGKNATIGYTSTGQTEAGKPIMKLSILVEGPKAKSAMTYKIEEGRPFILAGEKYQEGTLVYALTCRPVK